jgi:signal transduction histidine kinase
MKLFTKGLLLIGVPTLFELMLIGFLFKAERDAADADFWADHTKQVITTAADIVEPLLREDAALRNAALGDDRSAIGDERFWQTLDERVSRLEDLVSDNPRQVERVRTIRQDIAGYHTWDRRILEAVDAKNHDLAIDRMREQNFRNAFSDLQKTLADFLTVERGFDQHRVVMAAQARWQMRWSLVIAGIGSLLAGGMAAYLFSRSIGTRLATLEANARRLADGAPLDAPVAGNDEIANLDNVLHQSAHRLAAADLAQADLQKALEERANDLAQANEHLRQQTQENEMFIYSVSHDLRSPLVNLQGFGKELRLVCDDIRRDIASAEMPQAKKDAILALIDRDMAEALNFLQTAVGRAAGIIDALLRLSRAGRVEYRNERIDPEKIVQRVVDAMRGTIKERGVTVRVHPMPPAAGDATAIDQIFGNLIGNAVNYLDPQRPGEIDIGALPATPSAASNADLSAPALITYYVKDNGLGIPAAYMDKMFRAFQRLHGNIAKGEGIGLALVRRVVERHNGRVWVESQEGTGTTFFVSLPAWTEAPAASSETPSTEPA